MEKFDELLEDFGAMSSGQMSTCWDECINDDLWAKHFVSHPGEDGFQWRIVKEGLDVDAYRWYERSTTVIKIYGRLLGINHISRVFSEIMEVEDCGGGMKFFEMKEVPSVTYVAMRGHLTMDNN